MSDDPQTGHPEPLDEENAPAPLVGEFPDELDEYWAERDRAEVELLAKNSHSHHFVTLFRENSLILNSTILINKLYRFQSEPIKNQIASLGIPDAESNDYYDIESNISFFQELESDIRHAFNTSKQIQIQTYYSSLYNNFENYVISIVKQLLIVNPIEIKLKQSVNISYEELSPYFSSPSNLADIILNRLIGLEDKNYTLIDTIKYAQEYAKLKLTEGQLNALRRMGLIRHKITHLGGKVDAEFVRKMGAYSKPDGNNYPYPSIGSFAIDSGSKYVVTEEEFREGYLMILELAKLLDNTLCYKYPKIATLDPIEFDYEKHTLEKALSALMSLPDTKPESDEDES